MHYSQQSDLDINKLNVHKILLIHLLIIYSVEIPVLKVINLADNATCLQENKTLKLHFTVS